MLLDPQAGQEDPRPESRPVPKKPAPGHPLSPRDKAFPLPHIHPPPTPIQKRKPPPKLLSSSSHKTIQQEQFQGGLPLPSIKARNAPAISASHLHFSKNSLNPFFLGFPSSEATPFIASSNRFRASFWAWVILSGT